MPITLHHLTLHPQLFDAKVLIPCCPFYVDTNAVMDRRLSVRLTTIRRAAQMNKEAEDRKNRQKRKDEEQTKFFQSAQKKNASLQRKNEIESEKLMLEKEDMISTQKATLIEKINEHWNDGVEIPGVPMSKDDVLEYIFLTEFQGQMRSTLLTVIKLMTKESADFNTLSFGLRVAFKNYRNIENEQD